jgi:large subunit ribosomal protein L14
MVQVGTVLKVADNSGAKKLKLIGIPGSSRIRFASVGDIVTVAVSGADSAGSVKDHSVAKAVIVRTRKEYRRKDGTHIRFDDNAAVLITKDKSIDLNNLQGLYQKFSANSFSYNRNQSKRQIIKLK